MFDFKVSIVEEYAPFFISGALLTVKLSVIAIAAGFFIGLFLALARISSKKYLSIPAVCFIESIRGTPLLLQILITYFGVIPLIMRKPDGVLAAVIALSINARRVYCRNHPRRHSGHRPGADGGGQRSGAFSFPGHAVCHPASGNPIGDSGAGKFFRQSHQGFVAGVGDCHAGAHVLGQCGQCAVLPGMGDFYYYGGDLSFPDAGDGKDFGSPGKESLKKQ